MLSNVCHVKYSQAVSVGDPYEQNVCSRDFPTLEGAPAKKEKKNSTELYEDRDRKTQKIRKKPFLTG